MSENLLFAERQFNRRLWEAILYGGDTCRAALWWQTIQLVWGVT
jgi:hypothetical protein